MVVRRVLPAVLLLLACERRAPPQAALEPAPEPPSPPAAAEPPAAPAAALPSPAPAAIRGAAALEPGEVVAPLAPEEESLLDPAASFRLELAGPSHDARLVLLDASGAAVPATGRGEIGEATVLFLTPSAPLTPGARYQLRLDGAVTRDFHVGDAPHPPVAFALKVIGEPPAPAPRPTRPTHPVHRSRGH
jgi:hypothetical protein